MRDGTSNRDELIDVFDRHYEALYAYVAYRVTPDRQAAEDLTQEVFAAALNGASRKRKEGGWLTWLRSIARHKIADHYRSRQRGADDRASTIVPASDPATPRETEAEERVRHVGQIMRHLPERYVHVLEQKYIEGLSIREIARTTNCTEKAIESTLSRARDAFRTAYEKLRTVVRLSHLCRLVDCVD